MRGVLLWTAAPGLAAALAFAALAPSSKDEKNQRALGFLSSLRDLPKTFWHFLAGVFAHGIGDFAPTLLILRASQILTPRVGAGRAAVISVGLYTFHNLVNAASSYPPELSATASANAACSPPVTSSLQSPTQASSSSRQQCSLSSFSSASQAFTPASSNRSRNRSPLNCFPQHIRGSGFGLLATVNGVGDLISSIAVGALWSAVSPAAGFLYAAAFTTLGALLIYFFTGRRAISIS